MGLFQKLMQALGLLKRNTKIIVVGLDNSGKSTILNALKPQKNASEEVVPTVGFSEETFERDNLRFTAFDMSGAGTYRSLWESYYGDVQGIIFVVDCSDKIRMCVAKDELDAMLAHKDMKDAHAPLLVMANKQDLPGALEPAEVSLMLGLPSITSSPWQIQGSNALTGEGLDPGVSWLAQEIVRRQTDSKKAASKSTKATTGGSSSNTSGTTGGAGKAS